MQAMKWYEERTKLPEGVYVHGRAGRDDLNTGHVIQCTQSWDTAEHYGWTGTIWVIAAHKETNILDLTDAETHTRVVATLKEHYEDGRLPGDLDEYCGFIEDWDAVKLNPHDIVDGAEWFDVPFFGQWIWETFAADMVLVQDQKARYETEGRGAVVINHENVTAIRVK